MTLLRSKVIDCQACNGSGTLRHRVRCLSCYGSGEVEVWDDAPEPDDPKPPAINGHSHDNTENDE